MHHRVWLFFLSTVYLSVSPLSANDPDLQFNVATEEEALFVRRIVEFYQEEETELFLNQIQDFLKKYPKSALCQDLYALLGNYYMEKQNFVDANKFFLKIKDRKIQEKIAINHLQALYNLSNHSKSIKVASKYLDSFLKTDKKKHDSVHFFYADALYKQSIESDLEKEAKATSAYEAIKEFEGLIHSELSIQSMRSLAHLYYLFKKFPLSANTYVKLSEKDPDNKDSYLIKAANIEAIFDKEKAIQTFTQICQTGNEYSSSAAYNRMLLLYDSNKYSELIQVKDQLSKLLEKNKKPLLHFFLGKAHLKRADYKRAESELKEFLKAEGFPEEHKNAILSLAEIAHKLQDTALFNDILNLCKKSYKSPEEYSDVIFASALALKTQEKYADAEKLFGKILSLKLKDEIKANALFEYAHVLFLSKKWDLSHKNFMEFFEKNKNHPNNLAAIHFLLSTSTEQVKNPKSDFSKKDLCNELEKLITEKCLKNTLDEQKYRFLLAKTYFEMSEFKKSVKILKPLLSKCTSRSVFSEALVLNGYSLMKLSKHPTEYLKYFEKALEINPEMSERGKIHIVLYNTILKDSENSKKEEYLAKAADNLFKAYILNEPILRENLLWAADYFLSKKTKDYKKSIAFLESAITLKNFSLSAKELEDEIVKLSRLYQEQHSEDKQIALLDKLEKEYLKNPDTNWKYTSDVRYELAKNYEKTKQFAKAIMYYDNVFSSGPSLRGFIQAKSCLKSARLRLSLINDSSYKKNNPEIVKVLSQLKDLTIQKSLDNEPTHLEAGIEYIELLCRIEKLSNTSQKKLDLLKKVKQQFTGTETIVDKEYHEKRKSNEIKNKIFENYMKFLEKEIMLCEDKDFDLKKIPASFDGLLKQKNLSEFLKVRIESHLKKLPSPDLSNNESQ